MSRIVTKFRYYKPHGTAKRGGYANYIATRDGVEKIDDSKKFSDATAEQKDLITQLLSDFPDSKEMLEYEDYLSHPNIKNASEFITRCIEDNASDIVGGSTYADYIATRPRAERLGSHGLFTDDDTEIVLSAVSKEMNRYTGNMYTMIVSLRREDAERLCFNNAYAWRDMLRAHTQELSEALNIPLTHLKWYAAFHNESHHPHIHLMAYSTVPSEGHLTRKGIRKMRSSLANDIFSDEIHQIYAEQTKVRDTLKADWKSLVAEILSDLETSTDPHTELQKKLLLLAERLRNTKGKKVYGYLKKDVKDLVDSIVDLMVEDENIAKLYDLWWEKKCDVLRTYYQNIPYEKPPLSQNKEFKSIKNDIIREAAKTGGSSANHRISATAITGLLRSLANTFCKKIDKEDKKLPVIDRRQKKEEEEKRNAEFDMTL